MESPVVETDVSIATSHEIPFINDFYEACANLYGYLVSDKIWKYFLATDKIESFDRKSGL